MLKNKNTVKILSILFFSFLVPELCFGQIPMIKDIQLISSNGREELVIHYKGTVIFKIQSLKKQKKIALKIYGQQFPARLTRKIRSKKIGTPLKMISVYNTGAGDMDAGILIHLKGRSSYRIKKTPNKYRILISKKSRLKKRKQRVRKDIWSRNVRGRFRMSGDTLSLKAAAENRSMKLADQLIQTLNVPSEIRVYKGEEISFESSDAKVHDIFRLVSTISGLNIITSSSVQGTVSISIKKVPWDQLLDIVLQEKNLKATSHGTVVRITTIKDYEAEERKKQELRIAEKIGEPIFMAIIPVSFAKASVVKSTVSNLIQNNTSGRGGRNQENADDFVRGKIEVDERTNSLLVTNTESGIKRIRELVDELDVPTPQILIESKIITTSDNFSRDKGINWGGYIEQAGSFKAGFAANIFDSSSGDFSVKSGSTGGALGLRIGGGETDFLSFLVNFSETSDRSKIIAAPRIIVNNKQSATITDGKKIQIPGPLSDTGQPSAPTYIDANLNMSVTPQATNDGSVLMDIDVTKTSPEASGEDLRTSSIKTQVLVKSGSTLVMGGIYNYDISKKNDGLPILKDLPIVGGLFGHVRKRKNKSELLIFVTPRIINPSRVRRDRMNDGMGIEKEAETEARMGTETELAI